MGDKSKMAAEAGRQAAAPAVISMTGGPRRHQNYMGVYRRAERRAHGYPLYELMEDGKIAEGAAKFYVACVALGLEALHAAQLWWGKAPELPVASKAERSQRSTQSLAVLSTISSYSPKACSSCPCDPKCDSNGCRFISCRRNGICSMLQVYNLFGRYPSKRQRNVTEGWIPVRRVI